MAGDPVLHPEDRADEREKHEGPWLAVLAVAVVGWAVLAAVDRTLLAQGTILWATVRSLYALILAPTAAAALYQDTRALDAKGVEFGWLRFGYALGTLVAPPAAVVYLLHRRTRT
ncbi:MAG: hypothetical protein ABEJ43_00535 [Haloferacaceae archaeon]